MFARPHPVINRDTRLDKLEALALAFENAAAALADDYHDLADYTEDMMAGWYVKALGPARRESEKE